MSQEETQPELDKLLLSLDTVEAQRDILGDAVEPLLSEIRGRIESQVVLPTEDQKRVFESWQTLLETSQTLGITAPQPTPEVTEATEAITGFNTLMQKLGKTGSAFLDMTPDTPVEPPTKQPTPKAPPAKKAAVKKAAASKPKQDKPKAEPATTETEEPNIHAPGNVIIRYSRNNSEQQFRPKAGISKMYANILRKLSESEDGSVGITTYVRELTGGLASREIQLIRSGHMEAPSGVDIDTADKTSAQFYTAMAKLREKGIIEHIPGVESGNKATAGVIRIHTPVTFDEKDGIINIEAAQRPYELAINLYEQSIDNGRGKKIEIERERSTFVRIAQALGSISMKTEVEQERFTRSEITTWMQKSYSIDAPSTSEATLLSTALRNIVDDFDGDFPLSAHGVRGGSHYSWVPESKVEINDGWPEKPKFDDPAKISFGEGIIVMSIDGEDYVIFNAEKVGKTLSTMRIDIDTATLFKRSKSVLETLSLLGEEDTVKINEIIDLFNDDVENELERGAIANWIKSFVRRINDASDEDIINWRNHQGVLIDINRSIEIQYDDPSKKQVSNEDDDSNNTGVEIPVDEQPTVVHQETTAEDLGPVRPQKSAEELVNAARNLDQKTAQDIRGRLIQNGRFNYPGSLEEAVYLLQLITDEAVVAQLRESSRFMRDDWNKFQDFMSEVMLVCYVRTLEWGSFEEIIDQVRKTTNGNNQRLSAIADSIKDPLQSLVETITKSDGHKDSERRDNASYFEKALDALVDGYVLPPQNPLQAIGLLDILRQHRQTIANGKTQAHFNTLIAGVHKEIEPILGKGNLSTLIATRTPRRTDSAGRAVQTATGEQRMLSRTDAHRYPASRTPKRRRRNRS